MVQNSVILQCPKILAAGFPQRGDTMSLDTVQPKDVPRGKVCCIREDVLSLKTCDINGAQPQYKSKRYLNKPIFANQNRDIEGTMARSIYPPIHRVSDLSLTTSDIEYARPKTNTRVSNRCTDPVQPNYKLPSFTVRPCTPPRWNGRITNDVSDIERTMPRRMVPQRNYTNDPNDVSDIEFTCPNYTRRVVRPLRNGALTNSLDTKDINAPETTQTKPRDTNPLDPQYKLQQSTTTSLNHQFTEEEATMPKPTTQAEIIGPIAMSKPRKLTWDNGEPTFSLMREDITGAVSQRYIGACPTNIYDKKQHIISFHDPCDIPGAQTNSLKKGIVTKRVVNPLNPTYKMLDESNTLEAGFDVECERGFSYEPPPASATYMHQSQPSEPLQATAPIQMDRPSESESFTVVTPVNVKACASNGSGGSRRSSARLSNRSGRSGRSGGSRPSVTSADKLSGFINNQ